MKCGLVILNYEDYIMTSKLLDAVKDFPEIDHIVVVDNASPNESYEVLKQYESSIIPVWGGGTIDVLKSDRNGGYSYGNNIGIRYLIEHYSPDIIGIANPDVVFSNELVRRIKETFNSNPDYAVLTGFQLNANNETGTHPFWEDNGNAYQVLKTKIYNQTLSPLVNVLRKVFMKKPSVYVEYCERIKNNPEKLNQVWAVEGCLFFIRTSDFESVGLFDEKIFMYHEENILAKKIKRLGKKTGVLNDVTFIHNHIEHEYKHTLTLNMDEQEHIFYFCNYVTDSKILHVLYIMLRYLVKIKRMLVSAIQKLIPHTKI